MKYSILKSGGKLKVYKDFISTINFYDVVFFPVYRSLDRCSVTSSSRRVTDNLIKAAQLLSSAIFLNFRDMH